MRRWEYLQHRPGHWFTHAEKFAVLNEFGRQGWRAVVIDHEHIIFERRARWWRLA